MDFAVSVVIPIYNTEMYLEETIKSITGQSIGFQQNIQMILVNNASKGNPYAICQKYVEQYPQNVIYIEVEENHGPCSARNAGMRMATGKYINFCDSDDKWAEDAFEKAVNYLDSHQKINVLSCRVKHFDAFSDFDLFDFKFSQDIEVVDIFEQPDMVQFGLCPCLIRRIVAERYQHDERIYHAEDMKYLTEIILDDGKYGLLPDALFFYRQRISSDSTLNTVASSDNWYDATVEHAYFYLINLSRRKFGKVIPYIQYILLSEIRGRIDTRIPENYSYEHKEKYIGRIRDILREISDSLIMNEPHLTEEKKIYALRLKYGDDFERNIVLKDYIYKIGEDEILDIRNVLKIRVITIIGGRIIVSGFLRCNVEFECGEIYIENEKGERFYVEKEQLKKTNEIYSMDGECIVHGKSFFAEISSEKVNSLYFFMKLLNGDEIPLRINFLDNHLFYSMYFEKKDYCVSIKQRKEEVDLQYPLFPFRIVPKGSNVCIYGIGYTGMHFVNQILASGYCNIIGIVDQRYEEIRTFKGIKVMSIEQISECEFDYIVIAGRIRNNIKDIANSLKKSGISEQKIISEIKLNLPIAE
ncbi:MAG: glycosyltransferase family 2 protein [Lachnospiraceae bacterium]|nr:glycosyltransferase family 2 protein [Lachnospiraceae bacterium]